MLEASCQRARLSHLTQSAFLCHFVNKRAWFPSTLLLKACECFSGVVKIPEARCVWLYVWCQRMHVSVIKYRAHKKKNSVRASLMDYILHIFPHLMPFMCFFNQSATKKDTLSSLVARSLTPRHESRVEVKVQHMSPPARKIRRTLRTAGGCKENAKSGT